MMLGASLAAFLFIMCAVFLGMPISGTHTIVGALIGAGIVGVGASNIGWNYMIKVVASWFISPMLSAFLAFLLIIMVCSLTMDSVKFSLNGRLLWLTFITGASSSVVATMLINLLFKENPDAKLVALECLPGVFVVGLFGCRLLLIKLVTAGTNVGQTSCGQIFCQVLSFWTCSWAAEYLKQKTLLDGKQGKVPHKLSELKNSLHADADGPK